MKYLVVAKRKPEFRPEVGAAHQAWLSEQRGQGVVETSGPFTDGAGGAYVVLAESLEAARAIVAHDPLCVEAVSDVTVHEWNVR